MKVKIHHYVDASNGISLQIIPETDNEDEILRAFWKHGSMHTGHPCGEKGTSGHRITMAAKESKGTP